MNKLDDKHDEEWSVKRPHRGVTATEYAIVLGLLVLAVFSAIEHYAPYGAPKAEVSRTS